MGHKSQVALRMVVSFSSLELIGARDYHLGVTAAYDNYRHRTDARVAP